MRCILVRHRVDPLSDNRRTAVTAVDGLLETIVDTVGSGESVSITDFGVFESRARAARVGRNPRTGETVEVPATTVPAFRPGTGFRTEVGGGSVPAPRSAPTRPTRAAAAAASIPPTTPVPPAAVAEPATEPAKPARRLSRTRAEASFTAPPAPVTAEKRAKAAKGKAAKGKAAKGKAEGKGKARK